MKDLIVKNIKPFITALGIVGFVLACMYHTSCHITPEGIHLITNETESTKICSYTVENNNIDVEFTNNVEVEECFAIEVHEAETKFTSIDQFMSSVKRIPVEWFEDPDDYVIHYKLNEKTEIGKKYQMYSVVRERNGSSLSFAVPFNGENDHFPELVISEINEAYSKKENIPEYIELYAISSGNLFGLELITASDDRHFELPCIEVKKGEYIVVHLRKDPDDKTAITESGSDLTLSKSKGSTPARDIWMDNQQNVLNSSAEIVILNNKAKKKMMDCLMYCKKEYAEVNKNWKSEKLIEYSRLCSEAGLWSQNPNPESAVYSNQRKSISYISRTNINKFNGSDKIQNNAQCWTGTPKSKMTPGRANNW